MSCADVVLTLLNRLAKDEDDRAIERELIAGEAGRHLVYVVVVRTGDKMGAGTDANVLVTLYGDKVLSRFLQMFSIFMLAVNNFVGR